MFHLWKGSRSFSMDAVGAYRGLTISWNPVDIILYNFMASRISISTHFHPTSTNMHGRITNVYGLQIPAQKNAFLDFLY